MRIPGLDIPCRSYQCGNPSDGYDYDCDYELSEDITCNDCVCNLGFYNPQTGKRVNWFLRIIQNRRAVKYFMHRNSRTEI